MAARLTWVAERINLEAPGMPRPVDTLSGLAPLLRVWPELQHLCGSARNGPPIIRARPKAWAPFHLLFAAC